MPRSGNMSGMTYDCSSAVEFWMKSAYSELAESGFSQIDIDNLFNDLPRTLQDALLTA